jgi:GPH family glycoside/pentoside/hexuronide:cation symporter
MVKLGTAAAMLLSGIVLQYIGFDQNVQVQSAETITKLRIADIVIPIVSGIIAIIIIWKYEINEAKAKEIREALIARREKVLGEDKIS